MKKKLFFVSAVAITALAVCAIRSSESKKSGTDSLMLISVEALSRTEGTGNTGPREEKKCKGGYHQMVCTCKNKYECTDGDCN